MTIDNQPCASISAASIGMESEYFNDTDSVEHAYDYTTTPTGSDEYDYENPYWAPAEEKEGLLTQFRKLKIQSIAQKDVE